MTATYDTIAALVTPWMSSGVAIIRVSGPLVVAIIQQWLGVVTFRPRFFYKSPFVYHEHVIDEGLWVYFQAPHSYTGEDVLELYPHGSLVVIQSVLDELLRRGVRMAKEGEFTQRAYMLGKMDLAQAESVKELIDSVSWQGAVAACNSLRGAVSSRCYALESSLAALRVIAESYLDFSDSDIDPWDFDVLQNKLSAWLQSAEHFCTEASQGARLSQHITVAILGLPNAGKSSLMNILSNTETSIVSPQPGTTRDIVREDVVWGSRRVRLLDTAGIRETDCAIERSGIERIRRHLAETQLILWVIDISVYAESVLAAQLWLSQLQITIPVLFVLNKTDTLQGHVPQDIPTPMVAISCHAQEGIEQLIQASLEILSAGMNSAPFYASFRQVQAIQEALSYIKNALCFTSLNECYAQELQFAHICCMQIVGHYGSEDLLGDIFSKFCIGK